MKGDRKALYQGVIGLRWGQVKNYVEIDLDVITGDEVGLNNLMVKNRMHPHPTKYGYI